MKKCDIKGCNKNADVFNKELAFCTYHASAVGWKDVAILGV